jgi:hypothetical protein
MIDIESINRKFDLKISSQDDCSCTDDDSDPEKLLGILSEATDFSLDKPYFYTKEYFYRLFFIRDPYGWHDAISAEDDHIFSKPEREILLDWLSPWVNSLFYTLHNFSNERDYDLCVDNDYPKNTHVCVLSFKHEGDELKKCMDYSISIMYNAALHYGLFAIPLNLKYHINDGEILYEDLGSFLMQEEVPKYSVGMEYYIRAIASDDLEYQFSSYYRVLENISSKYFEDSFSRELIDLFGKGNFSEQDKKLLCKKVQNYSGDRKSGLELLKYFCLKSEVLKEKDLMQWWEDEMGESNVDLNNLIKKINATRNNIVHAKENIFQDLEVFAEDELYRVNQFLKKVCEEIISSECELS